MKQTEPPVKRTRVSTTNTTTKILQKSNKPTDSESGEDSSEWERLSDFSSCDSSDYSDW